MATIDRQNAMITFDMDTPTYRRYPKERQRGVGTKKGDLKKLH
jgi:hypothetical protein